MRKNAMRGRSTMTMAAISLLALTGAAAATPVATLPLNPPELFDDAVVMADQDGDSTQLVVNARVFATVNQGPETTLADLGNDFTNLEGATFELWSTTFKGGVRVPDSPIAETWSECAIGVNSGSCTITVPNTGSGQENENKHFFVLQTTPGAGAFMNPTLAAGGTTHLPGLTDALAAGVTQQLPKPYVGTNNGSFGAAANSLSNPQLGAHCDEGLSVAVIMDHSGSIKYDPQNGIDHLTPLRDALMGDGGLFDTLADTGSSAAMFAFAGQSPVTASPTMANIIEPLEAADETGRAELNAWMDRLFPSGKSLGGMTNWDAAFRAVINGNEQYEYDLVIFVTDGDPNGILASNGSDYAGGVGSLRPLEASIYAANELKTAPNQPRVVAVGVGDAGLGQKGVNLRAVSGPDLGNDYYQTADWEGLKQELASLATAATCTATVEVTKYVTDAAGKNPKLDAGWEISATADAGNGTVALLPAEETQKTNSEGKVRWNANFSELDPQADFTIAEDPDSKPGYLFDSGTCVISNASGDSEPISMEGPSQELSGITSGDAIRCEIYNRDNTATVTVVKETDQPTNEIFTFQNNLPKTGTFTGTGSGWADESGPDAFVLNQNGSYTVKVEPFDLASGKTLDIDEHPVPDGWHANGAPVCRNAGVSGSESSFHSSVGRVSITSLSAGAHVTCTVKNTVGPMTWSSSKSSNPTSGTENSPYQIEPGTTIRYYLYASNREEDSDEAIDDVLVHDDMSALLPYIAEGWVFEPEYQDRSDEEANGDPKEIPGACDIPGSCGEAFLDPATGQIEWNVGTLESDRRLRLAFNVPIRSDAFGVNLTNSMWAEGSKDPNTCYEDAPCFTYHKTATPEWTVSKTANPKSGTVVSPGSDVWYTVTATNTGTIAITDATVTDDLTAVIDDADLDLNSISWVQVPPGAALPERSGNQVIAQIPSLDPGKSYAFTYKVTVQPQKYDSQILNQVWGEGNAGGVPWDPAKCSFDDPCKTQHTTPGLPTLELRKRVVNSNGGSAIDSDFVVSATATSAEYWAGIGDKNLSANGSVKDGVWAATQYLLEENPEAHIEDGAYVPDGTWMCSSNWDLENQGADPGFEISAVEDGDPSKLYITLNPEADVTCELVNTDQPATLTLEKIVAGADVDPTSWNLAATLIDGGPGITGKTGSKAVTGATVQAGAYQLSESDGPNGFVADPWTCEDEDGSVPVENDVVQVSNGSVVTCRVVNNAVLPKLTLIKTVENGGGGEATATDWDLTAAHEATGQTVTGKSGSETVTQVEVPLGNYTLSEQPVDPKLAESYRLKSLTCTDATSGRVITPGAGNASFALNPGMDVTCEFVNANEPQAWRISKSSDPASGSLVTAGQEITYTLTAVNNSGSSWLRGATAVDDLSEVLPLATLKATGKGLVLSDSTLEWSIPDLAPGETASVTYQVVVKSGTQGGEIRNVVIGKGTVPPLDCFDEPSARASADCQTSHKPTGIPATGASMTAVPVAILLLIVGAAAVSASSRKKA